MRTRLGQHANATIRAVFLICGNIPLAERESDVPRRNVSSEVLGNRQISEHVIRATFCHLVLAGQICNKIVIVEPKVSVLTVLRLIYDVSR